MKFWQILMIAGETDGQKQMVDKSQAIRKAMLDSAYGIRPRRQERRRRGLSGRRL